MVSRQDLPAPPSPTAFALTLGSRPPADFDVVEIKGHEAVNRLYHFDVTFARRASAPTDGWLGNHARLELRSNEGTRYLHGVVTQVATLAPSMHRDWESVHRVRIAPRVSFLPLRKTSRIFQDRTVPEIIESMVQEIGAHVEARLSRAYAKREYCVQYQETDLAFIRRLAGEEGLFFFFAHPAPKDDASSANDGGREVLVLADAASHYAPIDGVTKVPFREASAMVDVESVHELMSEENVRPGGVLVRGFDYERPKFVPVAERVAAGKRDEFDQTALRSYDHDRVLEPKTVPQHVADLRLAELRADARVSRGASTLRRLLPGARFELTDHAMAELNGELVVQEIEHEGRQAAMGSTGPTTYENRFHAVPAFVALRPHRRARKLLQVTETALVVGAPGEEIHTDKMGRIKVQFHWDLEGKNDDKSSCWVRVMQPWAGAAWGTQFIPRVGMEVVITFNGGDPDRPLCLGSVYNGVTPPPFALPQEKTRSGLRTRSSPGGAGSNELSFEDAAGAEEIYLHAERDLREVVEHDRTRMVRGHEAVTVKESRAIDVAKDNIRIVRGSEYLIVEKDLVINVAGNKLIQVGRPPEKDDKKEAHALPEDASPYARFHALASLPMFDDAATQRASAVNRSKLLWQSEQLDGEAYTASQRLVGRATEIDHKLDSIAGACHLLTNEIAGLPDKMREAQGSLVPLDEATAQANALLERAQDLEQRIEATVAENREFTPTIGKIQKALVEHVTPKLERARQFTARLKVYQTLLEEPDELLSGRGRGGGGGTSGKFDDGAITFDALDKDKHKYVPKGQGSVLKIDGPGMIDASEGFKIKCGGTEIEITPGSILIKSATVKVEGNPINLNG